MGSRPNLLRLGVLSNHFETRLTQFTTKASYYSHLTEDKKKRINSGMNFANSLTNWIQILLLYQNTSEFDIHFHNTTSPTTEEIPTQNVDPMSFLPAQRKYSLPSFKLESISEDIIQQLVPKLDHKTATGHDDIPARFLKLCGHLITKPLPHTITRSLSESDVPSVCRKN